MCRKIQLLYQRLCPICAFLWLNHFPAQFLWHIQVVRCVSEPVQYVERWHLAAAVIPYPLQNPPANHNPVSNSTGVTAVQSCCQKWPCHGCSHWDMIVENRVSFSITFWDDCISSFLGFDVLYLLGLKVGTRTKANFESLI